jgi:PAS domain S-box-containing protein
MAVLLLAELITVYTGSGYSVVVITLLSVVLYTAYRFGTLMGLVSAVIVLLYNFHVVSMIAGAELFSRETLSSGVVIAFVFPVLAFIIGRLKARNDALLQRAEEARRDAEESARQLHFMAETMPQKIFTNLPNGKSVYINEQWHEYTGASKKTIANWANVVHPHDLKENMKAWKTALDNGEPFQFEHRLKRADGTYVWHLTRAQPLRDHTGKISLWIGSSTDIEDIRRARKLAGETARLIKQRTQLMELNRAKDEFISLASHQLRTPATGVKQYLNMALDGYAGDLSPALRQFLEKANNSNERQLDVIGDLLQVAQVDAGKVVLHKSTIDVNQLLPGIIHDQRSTFSARRQTVRFDKKKRAMKIDADPTKFRMIIENILDNASKYSFENTTITVTVSKYRGAVRIAVKDEGVGIDKSDVTKIFEKFMRLDNPLSTKVGGNGLGLYWAKKVIELHGGSIGITPSGTAGTIVTVSLPEAN